MIYNTLLKLSILLSLTIYLTSCSSGLKQRMTHLKPADFKELKGWQDDNHLAALEAFKHSCKMIIQKKHYKISNLTDLGGSRKSWKKPCEEALSGKIFINRMAKLFFEQWFQPYQVITNNKIGLYTGYYEVEIAGSMHKTNKFKHPVYKKPNNLHKNRGKKHISHRAINNGSLSGKNLELVWVDDPARLHFMHIQGCGSITLPSGKEIRLGYDGQNGFPYRAIGTKFKQYSRSKIESPLDMISWLQHNPRDGKKILESNPSYVFFKTHDYSAPLGGQGVPLTPYRSIAIDSKLYPYGMPIWIQTNLPNTKKYKAKVYNRLFIAQDTGGAINGAIRGDIFFGKGKMAEELAAYMNQKGNAYVLFPKKVSIPRSYKST